MTAAYVVGLLGEVDRLTADRDRLAGIVNQIDAYCRPILDSNPSAYYDTAMADHDGRQLVAEAVIDIIEGER